MENTFYYFIASTAGACFASYLAGYFIGKRKATLEALNAKLQDENQKRWQELFSQLNRREA